VKLFPTLEIKEECSPAMPDELPGPWMKLFPPCYLPAMPVVSLHVHVYGHVHVHLPGIA
jgi:hypothetical protein